jgi:serine/threonine protein kinase
VHRDVKPANILVDERSDQAPHVYLSDFGVSKGALSSLRLTAPGMFLGTPDYSAPEQVQGHKVDGRADQYALTTRRPDLPKPPIRYWPGPWPRRRSSGTSPATNSPAPARTAPVHEPYLWDTGSGKLAAILGDPGKQGVEALAFGLGGDSLAAGDADGSTYVWDIKNHTT